MFLALRLSDQHNRTRLRLVTRFLTGTSSVSSARLKVHRGEPTALTRLWAGNLGGLIGSVALVCWPLPGGLLDLIVEEVLGDGRVSAGGGV